MSGIGVGLSSSFLWASEGDVRQFFGGWFLVGLSSSFLWASEGDVRQFFGDWFLDRLFA